MRVSLVDTVRTKTRQYALPLGVLAATALVAVVLGPVASANSNVHEALHDLRHSLGLPCH